MLSPYDMTLSRLVTLPISSLSNLDIEANKFYDRAHRLKDAAILTRCYTHMLNMLFNIILSRKLIIVVILSKFNLSIK